MGTLLGSTLLKKLMYIVNLTHTKQLLSVTLCEGTIQQLRNTFLADFYHPPTYCNVLAVILLMTYHTRLCNSNTFADHPPTPSALRDM